MLKSGPDQPSAPGAELPEAQRPFSLQKTLEVECWVLRNDGVETDSMLCRCVNARRMRNF